MRWQGGRRSDNIEDRRGEGGSTFGGRGGGMRLPVGGRVGVGGGLGLIAIVLLGLLFGVDPTTLLQGTGSYAPGPGPQTYTPQSGPHGTPSDDIGQFVSVVLADTEDTWSELFRAGGKTYRAPTLVLFSGTTQSGCGFASAASGPFYCPEDGKLYLDTSFFAELRDRFGAPGDFAQAYVIAHEIGHHVQDLLGILPKAQEMQSQMGRAERNQVQVMVELQADCFAGVWAHHAQRSRALLEAGDIDEGLNAAAAIGDDRLQRQSQGYVVPDAFTHGSSQQRVAWFRRGLEQGTVQACNTFTANRP